MNVSMPRLSLIGLFNSVVLAAGVASAGDTPLLNSVAPRTWIETIAPENLPPLRYPSYENDLDKARDQANTGRYKLALQTLRSATSKTPGEVEHVRAICLMALGRTDEALEITGQSDAPAVQLDRIELIDQLGRTEEAVALARKQLQMHPESVRLRAAVGRLLEAQGDFSGAATAYRWFATPPHNFLELWRGNRIERFTDAEQTTAIARALDRWATLDGKYQSDPGLHDTLLNMFVKVFDEMDRRDWRSHVAAAEFYHGHDDAEHAQKQLAAALAINPNAAEAIDLAGRMAVEGYDFGRADAATSALRDVDPNSVQADLLQTRNLLRQRMPREAGELAARVLERRPNDLDALSLRAAAEALQLHNAATQSLLDEIDSRHPHEAAAYFEVAEQLGAMRQYPRSAAMYKVAVERAPWWSAPRNGLGLLYTQSGDEAAARATLDAAHNLDPFNVDTTNYLRLLDELDSFAKVETPHFTLRYNATLDPVIPEYYGNYLEHNYPIVTGEFRTEPPEKTIIEVFPTHDAFSVRTTGSPWIGTVGASTGRVIAMVSPRKGENTMGTFNWSQVLRHEFTHTVTLAATDNRISHWMTEGLAVMEEHSPLQWAWVPMLYHAVNEHTLFDMDQLTWAFVRPKKPTDRQLGYAESFWVCTYISERWGFESILKMLAAFKGGGLQPDVFVDVLHENEADFFKDFQKWCEARVAGWGYGKADQAKYDELRQSGEDLVHQKQYLNAVHVWEQIAALRPVDELPHTRLAGLYLSPAVNQPLKAIDHLKILHQVDLKDDRFAKRISRIYRDTGNLAEARDWALQAIYIDPYDADAHKLMNEVCEKHGDAAGVARETRVLAEVEQWKQHQESPTPTP